MASGAVRELITKIKFQIDKASESKVKNTMQGIKQQLNAFAKNPTKAKISVDTTRATSSIRSLKAQLNALSGKTVTTFVQTKAKGAGAAAVAKETTSGFGSGLAGVAGVIGGGVAISEIRDTADEMMNLDGRLRTVTKTEKERLDIESELYKRAQESRQSMQAMGDLYFKVARASQEMGFAQQDNLRVTETVSKALVIGGANAQEASATILQLGQALGSGRLQGDELRSLDENASILMGHVAKYFKTNVAGLKQLGAQGELTSDEVMRAILSASAEIDKEFSKMPMTFGQSMNVMKNSWDRFILGVEQKSSVFSLIARSFTKAFDSMGNKMNDFLTLMGKPDPNKKVTITEATTGETKEISETDYYNQKAKENPGMMATINALKKLEEAFDRLDGKEGNLDEQIGHLIETFMKIGLVVVPLLAVIGVIDMLIAMLSPFISLLSSIGGLIQKAFAPLATMITGAGKAITSFFSGGLNGVILNILGLIQKIPSFIGSIIKSVFRITVPLLLVYSLIQYAMNHWEELKKSFMTPEVATALNKIKSIWEKLSPVIEKISPLIDAIVELIGAVLWQAIKLVWDIGVKCFNAICDAIEWAIDKIQILIDWCDPLISKLTTAFNWMSRIAGFDTAGVGGATDKLIEGWLSKGNGSNNYSSEQNFTFHVSSPGQAKGYVEKATTFPTMFEHT